MADNFGNNNGMDENLDSILNAMAERQRRAEEKTQQRPAMRSTANGGKQPPLRTNPNARQPVRRSSGASSASGGTQRTAGQTGDRPITRQGSADRGAYNRAPRQTYAPQPHRQQAVNNAPAQSRPPAALPEKKTYKGLRRFFAVALSLAFFCVLVGGIVGGYVLVYMERNVSGDAIIDLDVYMANQSKTTIIYGYDNNGNPKELQRLHGRENRIWADLDTIPKNLQNAYIALEDKRFWKHDGVDWIRTVLGVVKSGFTQGGSTITQQLIKNLTNQNDRTFSRKFNEIIQALNLQRYNSKEKILEAYLNTLYLDGGCYGVETAANYYFGKHVQDLNLAECACIAAITKAPRTYDPLLNYINPDPTKDDNQSRQHLCLGYMLEQGMITEDEYNEAMNYQMVFNVGENKVKVSSLNNETTVADDDSEYQSYYIDYVIEDVIDALMSKNDITYSVAERMVNYGGLSIYCAVDMDIQSIMEDIYYNRRSFPDDEQIQSAMTVMDYNGRILGIVGGAGPKAGNRVLNMAADSPRQPGSSIKPLSVYAPAMNEGLITYSTKVMNYGFTVGGELWPHNYGGDAGSPDSFKTVQQAIAPSLNTVPAQILRKMGIETSLNYLENSFHLGHLDSRDEAYSPLATGGMTYGATTLEMAAAYAAFGNHGRYYKPYSYYEVKDANGKTILEHDASDYQQAIEPETADIMNKLLQTVVTASDGTARRFPVDGQTMFAKTGTTTDNNDSWFCAGTPYYVGSVWVGYADRNRELKNIGGNSPSGRIFQAVFNRIHEGLEEKTFEMSDNVVKRSYCLNSGKLATSTCQDTAYGWYNADDLPGYCSGNDSALGETDATTTDPNATTTDPTATTTEKPNSGNENPKPSETVPTTAKPTETDPPTETAAPPVDPNEER
ncbi:MAG: transglycosylase domain-containing protein [Clostridia bacterium]|nr:transglycosylase domain-containing protein [Clostridia bacterium]